MPGAGLLVGGDPGIGKSTLLLQMAAEVAETRSAGALCLRRRERPSDSSPSHPSGLAAPKLFVLAEIVVDQIVDQIERMSPALVIVDSIQAIHTESGTSAAGTVSQVRDCAAMLLRAAKQFNIPIFLVGHVTKEGTIAGPRVLEHMVDVVLHLEGERFHAYRLLRSVKNRFGSTNEVGIFEMSERGMAEVDQPVRTFSGRTPAQRGRQRHCRLHGRHTSAVG